LPTSRSLKKLLLAILYAVNLMIFPFNIIKDVEGAVLTFQQRHDMHHHNAVIMGLIESGDMNKLRTYIISYNEGLDGHLANIFCLNPIVKSIFNVYANKAKTEHIKTEFQVSIPENIGIDNTCVLSNVLENALEGCLRLPSNHLKEINVTIKYFDDRLRIKFVKICRLDITFGTCFYTKNRWWNR